MRRFKLRFPQNFYHETEMCLATSQPIITIKGQTKNSIEIEFLDILLWFFTFWTIAGFESNRKENPAMFKYDVGGRVEEA